LVFTGFDCTTSANGGALTADASGIISCTDDNSGGGASGMWQENTGAISPLNNTWDVLIGGTSTTSAKFAFINVDSNTPTASISANSGDNATYLTGTGILATTNMQTLTLGSATTGEIAFSDGTNTLTIDLDEDSNTAIDFTTSSGDDITFNPATGNVGIGTTTPSETLHIYDGSAAATILLERGSANIMKIMNSGGHLYIEPESAEGDVVFRDLGNTEVMRIDNSSNRVGIGEAVPSSILEILSSTSPQFTISYANGTDATFGVDVSGNLAIQATAALTLTPAGILTLNSTGDNEHFMVQNDGGGDSILQIEQLGSGDIMTASVSGITRFKIDTEGYTYSQRFSDFADPDYYIDPASGGTSLSLAGNIDTSNQTSDWILNAAVDALNFDSNTFSIDASGHKIGIGNAAPSQELDVTGNITLSGNIMGDSTDSLKLQAGGVTPGSTGTSSIYFLDSSGNTKGRYDTLGKFGDGSDGDVTISSDTNCSTDDISVDDGDSTADCMPRAITATATAGQSTVTVGSTTGFVAGDEVLIIQMLGTGEGNYETKHILNVDSITVLHFNEGLKNTYTDGGGNAAQVVRIPQYDDVTIDTAGTDLTPTAWDGTKYGVLFLRATGTVSIDVDTTINANSAGLTGGAGQSGGGGGAETTCATSSSVGNIGTVGTAGTAGTGLGAGGGGGAPTAGNGGGFSGTTPGGGGGGASGGGGAGGSYSSAASAPTAGANGGAGGTAQGAIPGTAGAAGSEGSAQGNSALSTVFMGSGGGGGASGSGGGSGACGAWLSCTAKGGAGGSGSASGDGGAGAGIVIIAGNTITNSGTISADGNAATDGSNGNNGADGYNGFGATYAGAGGGGGGSGGGGGGGSGGTVWLISDSLTAGTVNVDGGAGGTTSATGGDGGHCTQNGVVTVGGGGGGGKSGTGGSNNCDTGGANGLATGTGIGSAGSSGRTLQTTTNNYGTLYAGAINTVSADLAEYYAAGDPNLEAGDIVIVGPGSSTTVTNPDGSVEIINPSGTLYKSTSPYQPDLIGIVSNEPGIILGSRDNQSTADMRTVALTGRVLVKISPDSSPILIGDPLTSSSDPGQAAKATLPGPIIGKALEPWTPDNHKTHILTFINLSWHDPGIYLTDTSELEILVDDQASSHSYQIVSLSSDIIQRLAAYSEAIIAQIKAGFIQAQEIITQTLIANDKIITPTVETETLATDFISPLTDKPITITGPVVIEPQTASDSASPLALEVQGSASIAGDLIADRVITNELIANKIKASTIEGLRSKIEDIVANLDQPTAEPPDSQSIDVNTLNTLYELLNSQTATASASHLDLASINAEFGFFSDYLAVMGTAVITDLKVTNTLSINNQLLLASNSISTLGETLYLQPSGVGSINFLAGLMTLDETGQITINGDLNVTGTLTADTGRFNQLVLGKQPDQPDQFGQMLQVFDGQGNLTASIDSSGSAQFKDITTEMITIASAGESSQATASASITTNATAGQALLPAGLTEFTINTPHVTDQTLVYVTPIGNPQNQVLYVKSKKENDWFKIAINQPLPYDLEFNWWIIKLEI